MTYARHHEAKWCAALTFVALLSQLTACSEEAPEPKYSVERLMKPETCAECHPNHYREWSGSMHAYAGVDPVFLAMNRRGQEETNGALGDFCVKCHAPLAVAMGATTDGLNLTELEPELVGVGCYFCHNVKAVEGTHNNPLVLAFDDTLRGGIADPAPSRAHHTAYSPLMDGDRLESAAMCGSCHDITVPSPPGAAEVALERTFAEWQASLFNADPTRGGLTCSSCHMPSRRGLAADEPGVPQRRVHAHGFPAVDIALTPFPEREQQRAWVQRELDATLRAELCVAELVDGAVMELVLENVSAGHRFPSGAAHDRRVWVELIALAGDREVYQSGVIADDAPLSTLSDPDLWQLRDFTFKTDGSPAHMFWDVARIEPATIPGPLTFNRADPDFFATHVARRYPRASSTPNQLMEAPDRVRVRVRLRPMGLDVLDDLVASGHLDRSIRNAMPVFNLGTVTSQDGDPVAVEWTRERSEDPVLGSRRELAGVLARCVSSAPQR
ncbi:MAG: hypothetical protein KIT72_12265 [Polyangiaceae bacterium]|nr:hypothetical protein [Polyangiaceae bacterium]MCW5791188.1 hypothetical protein [Polyangiaceae bacterium]